MNNESQKKYITLDEVVETAKNTPSMGMWEYTQGINHLADLVLFGESPNAIITEDADFEIIPPKELPEGK